METPELSRVLEPIYRHQFSPFGWHAAAAGLALHIGGSAAFLLAGAGLPEAPAEPEILAAFRAAPDGAAFLRSDRCYVLKHTRHGSSAGIVVRDQAGRGLDEASALRLTELAPHLQMALTTSFDMADAQDRLILRLFDTLGLPSATLDPSGAIVSLNAGFRDQRFPFETQEGRPLTLRDKRAQTRFDQLLSEPDGPRSMLLRTSRAETATSLHLLTFPEASRAGFPRSTTLLVASPMDAPSADMIRAVLALSPGEAQLTRSILAGQSIDDIAGASGRSIHTVRNQLKAVLTKTGTRSQTHLATLTARLLPLRPPSQQ